MSAARSRPRLLLVSPAVPQPTGNGVRMRAWSFLLAAARDHRVTVVAGSPLFQAEDRLSRDSFGLLEGLAERVVVLPWGWRGDPTVAVRRARERLGAGSDEVPADWAVPTRRHLRLLAQLDPREFQRVHVSRLYMLPVALAILGEAVEAIDQLDLDDWESRTRRRIATLGRAADAEAYERLEGLWLPRLRRILVCSDGDRAEVSSRFGAVVETVPNAVRVPDELPSQASSPEAPLLFVGSLAYEPNADAMRFFATEVMPGTGVSLTVVGGGAPRDVRRLLARAPGVRWLGSLPSLDAAYAEARGAVAPTRAGGGTRIKILEAFAHGRAVVSTGIGVEGLDVRDGEHYLAAESPAEWAAACGAVWSDPNLRAALAAAAFEWVRPRSLDAVVTRAADLLA